MCTQGKPIKRIAVANMLLWASTCPAGSYTYEIDAEIRYDVVADGVTYPDTPVYVYDLVEGQSQGLTNRSAQAPAEYFAYATDACSHVAIDCTIAHFLRLVVRKTRSTASMISGTWLVLRPWISSRAAIGTPMPGTAKRSRTWT